MKKLWIAFAMALLALAFVAGPVLADGGNASVTCDPITVTDDSPPVGTTITFYGTVTCVANASSTTNFYPSYWSKGWTTASATSTAWYEIRDPDGCLVASDSNTESDFAEGSVHTGWWYGLYYYSYDDSYADAGQVFPWSADVYVDLVGDYIATQGGEVTVSWGCWTQTGHLEWVPCYGYQWVWDDPVLNATTLTDEGSSSKTVTSHAGVGMGMVASPPRLTIQLPAELAVEKPLHAEVFFGSDGWGDPTSQFIGYSDGIWQVEIADGTVILLDGEWQRYTWIEVDDQGNVTGRYGAGGHTVAEEIALSSPITITKVG
jgi:hypothetical protein